MDKIERSFPAPESLAKEAEKINGSYNTRMWNICFPIKMENTQKENLIGKIFSGPAATAMELKITATMMREF